MHYVAAAEDISLERAEAMLHILLKYGAKVNARDIDGRTPFLWAATYGAYFSGRRKKLIISSLQRRVHTIFARPVKH